MSEEPSTDAPEAAPPAPPSRPWWRRRPLAIGVAAGLAATAAVSAVVVAVQPGHTQRPAPCTMVTAATLARYLPDATQGPLTSPSIGKEIYGAGCFWSSYTLGGTRDLLLNLDLFSSPAAASAAERAHPSLLVMADCPCPGLRFTTRTLSGLGDQSVAVVMTVKTAAGAAGPAWAVPQIGLVVRSGDAIIRLSYAVYAGLDSPPRPTTATLMADTVDMAHDVMAALTGSPRVNATAPPAYPSSRGLLYAMPRNPCGLVKASTLTKYLPAVITPGTPKPAGSYSFAPHADSCIWAGDPYFVDEFVVIYSHPGQAQRLVLSDLQAPHQGGTGKFTAAQPVPGLGEYAAAAFVIQADRSLELDLQVSEANAGLEMIFVANQSPPPSRAAMLAADIALARDVLADLPRS